MGWSTIELREKCGNCRGNGGFLPSHLPYGIAKDYPTICSECDGSGREPLKTNLKLESNENTTKKI